MNEDKTRLDKEREELVRKTTKTLISGEWKTTDYIFLVTCGGPTILVDGAMKMVSGYWTPEEINTYEGYNKIAEWLDKIYE